MKSSNLIAAITFILSCHSLGCNVIYASEINIPRAMHAYKVSSNVFLFSKENKQGNIKVSRFGAIELTDESRQNATPKAPDDIDSSKPIGRYSRFAKAASDILPASYRRLVHILIMLTLLAVGLRETIKQITKGLRRLSAYRRLKNMNNTSPD